MMEDVDIFVGEVEEQELPEVIEENGLVYHLAEDGCYYPDLTFEQETDYLIGKYGLIRAEYMWENRAVLVKLFCNTLFDKYLTVTSLHRC